MRGALEHINFYFSFLFYPTTYFHQWREGREKPSLTKSSIFCITILIYSFFIEGVFFISFKRIVLERPGLSLLLAFFWGTVSTFLEFFFISAQLHFSCWLLNLGGKVQKTSLTTLSLCSTGLLLLPYLGPFLFLVARYNILHQGFRQWFGVERKTTLVALGLIPLLSFLVATIFFWTMTFKLSSLFFRTIYPFFNY